MMAIHGEERQGVDVSERNGDAPYRYGRFHDAHKGDASDFGDWRALGAPRGPLESNGAAAGGRNENIPTGYIFLGQFIAHDLSYDPTSLSEQEVDPAARRSFRTPRLDLDSLYGAGPLGDAHLYDPARPELFLDRRDFRDDVPRTLRNVAVIADPRNDQTLFLSQLQLAFLRFHNGVVRLLRKIPEWERSPSAEVLSAARTIVRWHYHWIILNDYLRRICLDDDWVRTANRRWRSTARFFDKNGKEPFIPVEFSDAVFRFGHSQVSPRYRIRRGDPPLDLLEKLSVGSNYAQPDWSLFFGDGPHVQYSNKVSRRIESFLFDLPPEVVPGQRHGPGRFSLPLLTLSRGISRRLPSGSALAADRLNDERRLRPEEIWEGDGFGPFEGAQPPLWYYILREAEVQPGGRIEDRGCRLGPLGSDLVWTVLVDLVSASRSYPEDWRPRFLRRRNGLAVERLEPFDMSALLEIARDPLAVRLDRERVLRDVGTPRTGPDRP